MSTKNTTTISEIRFMYSSAKISRILLDNAIAQVLSETIEQLHNTDIKRMANLHIAKHGGQFDALLELIETTIMQAYPMDLLDYGLMFDLKAKITSIAELYDGYLVVVPSDAHRSI